MDLNERYGVTDDCTWYLAGARGEKAGPRLVSLCRLIANEQSVLRSNSEKCMAVFQWGGDAIGALPGEHFPIEDNLITFNAAKNCIETVHAKICKSRIAPMPLTEGGGYLERQRAKEMGQALEGVITDNDGDQLEDEMILDALTTDHGAGAMKVVECYDTIKLQHIPIEDVWYDEAEVRQRQPRSMYHVPLDGWDKYVAIETFAADDDDHPGLVGTAEERRKAIIAAASRPESWRARKRTNASERVDIYEAWHLPSGDVHEVEEEYEETDEETGEMRTGKRMVCKHDGRHTVAVDGPNGTLIDEPWDGEGGFPIVTYTPRKRRRHVLGMSLMRDLIAPQREYEKLTKKIQNQHQKMGISGFCVRRGDELDTRELETGTFAGGVIVETNEQPPVPLVTEPVAAGTYAYADSIPRNMLERNGISTMSASSQVPAGLSQASGKALQVFDDAEDVRLLAYHRERAVFKIKLSWCIAATARRIVERVGSYKVPYESKKGIVSVDWKNALLDKGKFKIRVFPVSELSKNPAAKFAQLDQLMDRGAITIDQFKRLFDLPDLEAENETDLADQDIIDRTLDIMVTRGRYMSPEPFDNLDLIIQRAGKFYNLCRQQEVPPARLQLVRDYIVDAKGLKEQAEEAAAAKAAAMPMGAPPMGPPPDGGMPMPPPMAPDAPMPMPMPQAA
jgi:hypothetical protein